MTHRCEACGKRIPAGRLKALPDTRTCVKCSDEKRLTDKDVPTARPNMGDYGETPEADE